MEPVLEVPNVINVFSTTVLNGKKKTGKGHLYYYYYYYYYYLFHLFQEKNIAQRT